MVRSTILQERWWCSLDAVLYDQIDGFQNRTMTSLPGIRSQGLDVGASNNNLIISNNTLSSGLSVPAGSVYGAHFDGNTADFVGSVSPESNTGTFDTTNKKFGSASIAYTGGQFTQYADSPLWDVGSGDWYVEFWVKRAASGVAQYLYGQGDSGGTNSSNSTGAGFAGTGNNLPQLFAYVGGTSYVAAGPAITDTNWHYFKAGRVGNQLICSSDGILGTPIAITGTINNSINKFCIGRFGEYTPSPTNGNIDEFLFVKGVGMNTTNFTPPTEPYSPFGYLLKSLTRLNLDRLTFPKIYKPANTKCQVDVLGASIRANTATGGSATTITLDASASAVDDFYNGNTIILKTLTGAAQSRVITDYVGSTKVATVSTWTTNPANLTTFEVFQTIQSDIQPGFDFSTIDYTVYPTVNVICSIEKQAGATASPSMGVPVVTSIEKDWTLLPPVNAKNTTTTYSTVINTTGKTKLKDIFIVNNAGAPTVRITADGVLFYETVLPNTGGILPFDLVCSDSLLVELKSGNTNLAGIIVTIAK